MQTLSDEERRVSSGCGKPPCVPSAKSIKQRVERLFFLRGLDLPALPQTLYQKSVFH
jgi:hypothetical protein